MGDDETKGRNKELLVQTTRSRMHALCRVIQMGPVGLSTPGDEHSGEHDVGDDEGDGGVVVDGGRKATASKGWYLVRTSSPTINACHCSTFPGDPKNN